MRVVLASNLIDRGGVWRHILDIASELGKRDCDVTIALPTSAHSLRDEAHSEGLLVQDLSAKSHSDVWHLHLPNTYDRWTLPALAKQRLSGSSILITEHLPRSNASDPTECSTENPRHLGAWAAKTALKRAQYALCDRVVCVSGASRRFLMLRYGLDQKKIVVIPNGVRITPQVASWPQGQPLFVAIGAVILQKGFDTLLEASARSKEIYQVKIIGDGAHREGLQSEAKKLKLPVTFVGSRANAKECLAAATALVVPSRWESSSYVSLEAMEQARPVIASRVDSLPEIIVDEVTGFLVEPGDPGALAGALDRLARDQGLAQKLGQAGRLRVREFDLNMMVNSLYGTYRNVLEVRSGHRVSARHRG